MATSYLNVVSIGNVPLTRGLRNNNPGNLRRANIDWNGKVPFSKSTDTAFEQFYELRYGLRAMMRNLVTYHKRGFTIVPQIISAWAPAHENNTPAYIASVTKALGLASANAVLPLTEETIIALAKAIVRVELGATDAARISDSDYNEAMALNADLKLKKKAIPQQ